MDGSQGMVAVVRGLGDSQLAVTVLDSGKQYTLLPTSVLQPTGQQNERSSSTNTPNQYTQSQCHAAAQATDGQYATVYKTTHCKVRPTSPPIQLTEFPPQRAAVAPGEGNFEIGGTGSGDTSFNFLRANGAYRGGGMVWPDRGCVCSPRASREPDAFADSLRKYPAISPERSAEIVERLVNYTQGKNFAKVLRQSNLSPTRLSAEQNDGSPTRCSSRCKGCDLEKTRYRFQGESPTKDRQRKTERLDSDGESRRTFTKSFDVRHVKDVSRKFKEGMRNNPYMAQCPSIREAFEIMNDAAVIQKPVSYGVHPTMGSGSHVYVPPLMVNSQTQAAASMACKEVSTESRHKMFSRNVAVPLSPPSDVSRPLEGAVFDPRPLLLQASVQTAVVPLPVTVRKSVQTTHSSIDITSVKTTQYTKKCRSEIELSNKEVREEILGWLIDVLHSTYSKKLRADVIEELKEKIKNVSNDFGGEEAKVTLKVASIDDECCKDNLENICDELVNKVRIKNRYLTQIYRAEVVPYRAPEDLKKAIKDWLLELPMRTRDYSGKYINEEQMLANFVKRLKKALFSPNYDAKKLRNEIVKILQDIPIDNGSTNQNIYLNRLANNLVKKLLNANYFNKNQTTKSEEENKATKKGFHPNENEIKDLVRDEMIDFLDKFDIKISLERLQHIESDILGKIMEFLYSMRSSKDENFIDDVTRALQGIGAFEHQALYFANIILDHLKELLTTVEKNERDQARRLHMMTVLNSAVNEITDTTKRTTEKDKENNLDGYIQHLTEEIDEWLAGLELEIPWSQDESFRQVVVNDLAEDIVDRYKYVQLNRNIGGTEKEELEYLKYLIFKWINKLVGEEHQETIEHAPELLRRIRSVPVPLLAKSNVNGNSKSEFSKAVNQKADPTIGYSTSKNFQAFTVPIAGPSRIENPTSSTATATAPPNMGKFLENIRVPPAPPIDNIATLQHINLVYDDFVRKWVKAVPIPAYSSEEIALAETMRVGLYNGIFQIVTKLRFQPQLLFNPFYYQDALSEELEELLSLLPQTPEFLQQKKQLKALMLEKTTELNELIKMITSADTFKEKIIHKYRDYVPRLSTNLVKECPLRLYEELQILNIAEDFLLFTKYKEENPLKAYMYQQKLIERIKELITEMKNVHGTELKNINPEVYMNEVVASLQQVPLPSEDEIREAAEQVLLGHAIEEWYMALPLAHNNNLFEQLKRRHLRNALTKKIQNMEKSLIASGNTPEHELRHEISKFLEQIPLGKDETVNINYMVEALVDKVKDIVTPNSEVLALYNSSVNFSGFGKNAALHSTTMQVPDGYRLVGPLPPCCAAGLDKILAQPGPSGLQVQTAGASPMELERRASMIGGAPPLATQSFGQQSSDGLRQNQSLADAQRQRMAVNPNQVEPAPAGTDLAADDGGSTQRRTSLYVQAGQSTSHERPSLGESGNLQDSSFANGQRRPSMGESEHKTQPQSIGEGGNVQILHVSGSASGYRKPSMDKLENNTQGTSESTNSGSARGQRKPSMGMLGNNTHSENSHKHISCKDLKNTDRFGQRQCNINNRNQQRQTYRNMLGNDTETLLRDGQRHYSEQIVECLCSSSTACKSPSQTKLCYCNKANTEKNTSGENKKCCCAKSCKEKPIRLCSHTETMTETKTCLCKGNKICLCRKTLASADIGGQTSNQAVSNIDGHLTLDHLEYSVSGKPGQGTYSQQKAPNYTDRQSPLDHTDYSISGKPEQGRYFHQQLPGTDYDYEKQMTQESNTLTNESSLAQTQGLYQQGNISYDQPPVDERRHSRLVQGHVPGPTRRDTRDAQTASGAITRSDGGGGGLPGAGAALTSTGTPVQRSSSLAQNGSRRLSHRVSIISPQSQERLRLLSENGITTTDQQDPRGARSSTPDNDLTLNEDVGTYDQFQGGRPRSSSLRVPMNADPTSIGEQSSLLEPQGRRISGLPIQQSSPIQNYNPLSGSPLPSGSNGRTLSDISRPQWVSFPQTRIEAGHNLPQSGIEAGNQAAAKSCVCPPYVSMLSPEQVSMLSPQRTGFDPNQMFAPAFSPGQMFHGIVPANQSLPGMFFGANGTLPNQSQFRQAPQRMSQLQKSTTSQPLPGGMSQLRQSSLVQPLQGGMNQLRQSNNGQPLQGGISQIRPESVGQPLQGGISQLRHGSIGQPLQGRMSQSRQGIASQPLQGRVSQSQQGMAPPSSLQDSRYTRYIPSRSPGAVSHDFPEDGHHRMQMSEEERSTLMHTMPPAYQSAQPDLERVISMPNRTQIFQDTSMEGGQASAVQRIQEEEKRSMIEENVQSIQEENTPGRASRTSTKASFSQNMQSRSRQNSIHEASPEQVEEIAQLRPAAQDRRMSRTGAESMQRRESQGRSVIPTIQEDEQQNISVQTGNRRASWQIPRQNVTPLNVPQDDDIQEMGPSEAGMSQADRRASQAIRRASQGAADQGWVSFGQEDASPEVAQDSIYQQEMIQPDRRISQSGRMTSQSAVGEPIGLNYPSISAGQSPALQDLVQQIPPSLQGPYPAEQQGYQNDMLMAGYISGQPGQEEDPRAYIQPAAFSTPQRPIPPGAPGRPVKRGKRRHPRKDDGSSDSEQRGRNFDDRMRHESDSDSDHGLRIRCRCYERLRRFRRRNERYAEECDIPCPYGHYYYSCF